MAGILSEAAGEEKRSPLLTGLRQKKGVKEVKKEKKTKCNGCWHLRNIENF